MSISAHKLKHAFHVNYNNMLLAKRVLTDSLLTESSQELLTEASAPIHSERCFSCNEKASISVQEIFQWTFPKRNTFVVYMKRMITSVRRHAHIEINLSATNNFASSKS